MKPNKYAKAKVPEPKVLIPLKGSNRKDRRKLLLGMCPCGSGRKFYKCHLPIEQKRQEKLMRERAKEQLEAIKGGEK